MVIYTNSMATKSKLDPKSAHWYSGADIPMRIIRKFAREVAERFQPDKIVLFGSYAYGTPNENSDVDILVIMPCRNQHDQSVKIRWEISAPFPMDLIVRTPHNLGWRLEERESFHTEIMTRGKVLYEKNNGQVGGQSGFPCATLLANDG